MLLEYIGPGEAPKPFRQGVTYDFSPKDKYGGATVCDVINSDSIREFLQTKTLAGVNVYRRFQLAAMDDPEFVRQVQRNPCAAMHVLSDMFRAAAGGHGESLVLDDPEFTWELAQSNLRELEILASELGIRVHANTQRYALMGAILSHCKSAPKFAFPRKPPGRKKKEDTREDDVREE